MIRSATGMLFCLFSVITLGSCTPPQARVPSAAETVPQPAIQLNLNLPRVGDLLVRSLVRQMNEAELVGQMIMVGLEQDETGSAVTVVGDGERQMLRSIAPGGVILFGANIVTVDQVQTLVGELQRATDIPLIIATDHEGGLVSRLTSSGRMPATVMPSATLVGIAADVLVQRGQPEHATDLAREWGYVIGCELRALGITMNMAPVADVNNIENPGLLASQRRTYGSDPALVGELVAATVSGMHAAGVTAVLKHFPGQGAATLDSHTAPVALDHTRARLDQVDLVPFVAGINAGARAIMSAHISYPRATGGDEPATTSPQLLTDLLRHELGFDGVVVTDALNMDAVALRRDSVEVAMAAIRAGADIMLKPIDPAALHAALVDAVNSGMLSRERLEESVRRIMEVKLRAGLFGPSTLWTDPAATEILGSAAHQDLVEEIRSVARSRRE
ncbi:MAG: glycoside hydrolase family 3 protein [Spirochaetales bacterium]|nr:glycoside hydrolase family 3 protein [Spirochaetales bacterium]